MGDNRMKLNVKEYVTNNKEIKEKIGDIIKDTFPFYVSYKIKLKNEYYCEILVNYYYMGKETNLSQVIPIDALEREHFLTGLKDFLLDVRKDLISYPDNETQQEFLRK
jgi:hypothetical protein